MGRPCSLHGGVGGDLGLDDFEGVGATRALNHTQRLHHLFSRRFICHFTVKGAHHQMQMRHKALLRCTCQQLGCLDCIIPYFRVFADQAHSERQNNL